MIRKNVISLFFLLSLSPFLSASDDYDLWRKARKAWHGDEFQAAAEAFQGIIENHPKSRYRCKSGYYLGYCYYQLGDKEKAFDILTQYAADSTCPAETIADAKDKRLQIAYELAKKGDEDYKRILIDSLKDESLDARFSAAVFLSQLDDDSGIPVFFEVLEKEFDTDLREIAMKHILKLGSKEDKAKLEEIIKRQKSQMTGKPKMIRLIIRELDTGNETKVNLPIGLYNVVIKSLTDDQLDLIQEQAGIDLRKLELNLEDFPKGKVIFSVVDGKQEIKLFLD